MRWLWCCWLVAGCSYNPTPAGSPVDGAPGDSDTSTEGNPTAFARRINVAGNAYTGVDFGGDWEQDPGICNGTTWTVTAGIRNTNDGPLFSNHRFAIPDLQCAVPNIPAGTYQVTLVFGPTYYWCPGAQSQKDQRFRITLEGNEVEADYNVSADSGGCVLDTSDMTAAHPVSKTYTLTIDDGELDVDETAPANESAMLSAIAIVEM